jgi:hypothetical protein
VLTPPKTGCTSGKNRKRNGPFAILAIKPDSLSSINSQKPHSGEVFSLFYLRQKSGLTD